MEKCQNKVQVAEKIGFGNEVGEKLAAKMNGALIKIIKLFKKVGVMDGWMGGKASLKISYSNQHICLCFPVHLSICFILRYWSYLHPWYKSICNFSELWQCMCLVWRAGKWQLNLWKPANKKQF